MFPYWAVAEDQPETPAITAEVPATPPPCVNAVSQTDEPDQLQVEPQSDSTSDSGSTDSENALQEPAIDPETPVDQGTPATDPETPADDQETMTTPETPAADPATPAEEAAETEPAPETSPAATAEQASPAPKPAPPDCSSITQGEVSESDTETQTGAETGVSINNENNASVANDTMTSGESGGNQITGPEEQEQAQAAKIDTGDVNVYANVLNIVNTNEINSEIVQVVENYNNLTTDLLMNEPEMSPQKLNENIVSGICPDVSCTSLSTYKLSNKNKADINNKVEVNADSGNNSISNPGSDSEIKTGSVKALVNIVNIVNTNLVNSRWTIATFNIFGDWEGDLVLPSELYFDGYRTTGKTSDDSADLGQVYKVVLDVTNNNEATIGNNVDSSGDSGSNAIDSGERLSDSAVETGDVQNISNVRTVANSTVVNTDWFLSIVNTLGSWTGNVYSLPENMSFEQTPLGLAFFSTSSGDERLNGQFTDSMSDLNGGQEVTVEIENDNQATIENDVKIKANSGKNRIEGAEDTSNTRIISGPVRILSNILNFANTNLIYSNLNLGIMNVFGKWNGNVVFGYPDLTIEHKLGGAHIPASTGQQAEFKIYYGNNSGSSMQDARLAFHFDPHALAYSGNSAGLTAAEPENGIVEFDLGKLSAQTNGMFILSMSTVRSFTANEAVETMAAISGTGPEKNLGNNTSTLISTADNPPSGGGGGGGGGGGNANGGSSGGSGGAATGEHIKVVKTNDAATKLKSGDSVSFQITMFNENYNKVQNAALYDTLKGPDGAVITSEAHDLGELQAREEIDYAYTLVISETVSNGTYANSAYIEGQDASGQTIKSDVSTSSFEVENPLPQTGSAVSPAAPAPLLLTGLLTGKVKGSGEVPPPENTSPRVALSEEPAGRVAAATTDVKGGLKIGTGGWLIFYLVLVILAVAVAYELLLLFLKRNRSKRKPAPPRP